jgi:hypothetical protein
MGIKLGTDLPKKSSGSSSDITFFRLKGEGESAEFMSLIDAAELVSVESHEHWDIRPAVFAACTGKADCPGCQLGNKARFKSYMPAMMLDGTQVIVELKLSVGQQFAEMAAMLKGKTKGVIFRLKRTGKGFDTRYAMATAGMRGELPEVIQEYDWEKLLGPFTRPEILAHYIAKGVDLSDVSDVESAASPKEEEKSTSGWGAV